MREFEFSSGAYQDDPASPAMSFRADTMHGPAAVWTLKDVHAAIQAYARKFGLYRTTAALVLVTDLYDANKIPTRLYGVLICYLCQNMTSRPHRRRENVRT